MPQDVANAWLNYTREGVGMFWWGGYGISTEHTAYLNLKNGIPAPRSGSIGHPKKAAEYGKTAASVSHDGEGVYGAAFFCACIAEAFVSDDVEHIIETGLQMIPKESVYAKVSRAVIAFYRENPDDWRACHELLVREWGYDKYRGVCHIIPNAGVCVLSMLYGKGDFARTVEIATMCGWDI